MLERQVESSNHSGCYIDNQCQPRSSNRQAVNFIHDDGVDRCVVDLN